MAEGLYHHKMIIKAERFDGSAEMARRWGMVQSPSADDGWVFNYEQLIPVAAGRWLINDDGNVFTETDAYFKKAYSALPVIPAIVAEWFDHSRRRGMNFYDAISAPRHPKELDAWLMAPTDQGADETLSQFMRAWLDGYIVAEKPAEP